MTASENFTNSSCPGNASRETVPLAMLPDRRAFISSGKVYRFPGFSVHFPHNKLGSTAIYSISRPPFSGKVNQFVKNQVHFPPPHPSLAAWFPASLMFALTGQKYGSRLGNANKFVLLSASAYICPVGQKYGSRLGNASHAACMHVRFLHGHESESSFPRRPRTCQCKFICIALGFCVYLYREF